MVWVILSPKSSSLPGWHFLPLSRNQAENRPAETFTPIGKKPSAETAVCYAEIFNSGFWIQSGILLNILQYTTQNLQTVLKLCWLMVALIMDMQLNTFYALAVVVVQYGVWNYCRYFRTWRNHIENNPVIYWVREQTTRYNKTHFESFIWEG